MELKMFSIFDSAVKTFHPPWFKPNLQHAIHDFKQIINDNRTNLYRFPHDYDLYYLGVYDDTTGKMSTLDSPEHVQKAVSLKDEPVLTETAKTT